MNQTPKGNRKHIVFYGKRNAGKSSLMNGLIGQEISLVSDTKGTTTDPVSKAVELIPYGPVVLIDTGGIDDEGELGRLRVEKTLKTLAKTDLALYVMDSGEEDSNYQELVGEFKKRKITHLLVLNKMDERTPQEQETIRKKFPDALLTSAQDEKSLEALKTVLIEKLQQEEEDPSLIEGLIPYGGKIILVVPIDSEAPKGRLILPQVQLIRECLDQGIKSYVVRDTELSSAIEDLPDADLVVTDSQIFKAVDALVPQDLPLTSFSILMARQKGDLETFLEGIRAVEGLKEKEAPKVLIMESCAHNTSHEDIGRVKIPKQLTRHIGKGIDFSFKMGEDFPDDLERFDLVIHCGSCMLNKKTMETRIDSCKGKKVPITNYGLVLAHLSGILERAIQPFA